MAVTANNASQEETQDDTMQALTNDFQYSDGSILLESLRNELSEDLDRKSVV